MNNGKKSDTQKYNYARKRNRNKRGGSGKMVFIILLSLLILALIAAIAFVIVDLVGSMGDDTDDPASDTTTAPTVNDEHSLSHAIDGNSESYMLSVTNQTAGSYFSCEFDAVADVGSVIVASTDPELYIRGCEVQLLSGGEWITIGIFGSSPNEKTYTVGNVTLNATAVRVLLTEDADSLWSLNELTVTDKNGNPIHLRAPFAGTNGTEVVNPETTTPPDVTTGQKVEITEPPVTEPPVLGYTTIEMSNSNLYTGALILVNSQYSYHFPPSEASLLTVYNEYVANNYRCNYFDDTSMQLDATATRNILALANALYTDTGLNWLKLGTGYRSYEVQQALADKYPATAALPGYSEHHTGLGVDLQIWDREKGVTYNFDEPNQNSQTIYSWITANAYKYGYVRRFAPDKDNITYITSDRWHYRYVGVPHAYYMTANNLCLEEYLAWLESYTYEGNHLFINGVDGKNYEVYFVAAEDGTSTTLPVPTNPTAYTVSGNNYSGFIVTVTLN